MSNHRYDWTSTSEPPDDGRDVLCYDAEADYFFIANYSRLSDGSGAYWYTDGPDPNPTHWRDVLRPTSFERTASVPPDKEQTP